MSNMSRLDVQLQDAQSGIQVDDITSLIEWYIDNLSLHPVTNQQYTYNDIVVIICKFPQANWTQTQQSRLYMECCLQRDIISELRLDAIQYHNALADIESVIGDDVNERYVMHDDIESIIKLARNMGV